MNGDLYERAKSLYLEALERPEGEREAFVRERAADDPDAADEAIALLREGSTDDGLGTLAAPSGLLADAGTAAERAGDRVGNYELVRRLGEGGMGVVWLARQTAPIERDAALKVIRLGMDTESVVRRFEAERRTLARMDHPNIARVYDAGATDAGRPYFAMEYADGEAITAWCDRRRLPTRERVELLITVCQAVQHAHQKGVIHRDLKPSNILVSEVDGAPFPRVIDFGIAKATTDDRGSGATRTEAGRLIGTPEYMSPEQAGVGGAVDTRTDIYALGVILYELVAGVPPFRSETLRTPDLVKLQNVIATVEPDRPSTRLGSLSDKEASRIARARRTEPSGLRRALRGDLDWIVMKAMAKERDRRYASASELAADLARSLASEPVVARPPGAWYRAARFVRRHRVGVAAAAFVAAGIVAGGAGLTAGFVRASAERERALAAETEARREADRARTQALRAERSSAFLREMLEGVGPSAALGRDATILRDVLDRTRARLGELDDQPEVKAGILRTIADTRYDLGDYEAAEAAAREALSLFEATVGAGDRRAILAAQRRAQALISLGRPDEAEAQLDETRAVAERAHDAEHALIGRLDHARGSLLRAQGRLEEAAEAHAEAARRLGAALGPDDEAAVGARFDHAAALTRLGRYEEAEPIIRDVLETRERALGPDHPLTLFALSALAILHGSTDRYEEGLPFYREALARRRDVLGPDHPETITSVNNLAYVYARTDRLDEAEAMFREVYDARARTRGESAPDTLLAMNNLGAILRMRGETDEATPILEKALRLRRETLGPDHPDTLYSVHNLAALRRVAGDLDRADDLARRAYEGRLDALGADHPDTIDTLTLRVEIALERERADQAGRVLDAHAARRRDEGQDEESGRARRAQEQLEALRERVAAASP